MRRHACAVWEGNLEEGSGKLTTQSTILKDTNLTYQSRFTEKKEFSGTNPEELVAAGFAGCYCMQLSHLLTEAGNKVKKLEARVHLNLEKAEEGFAINTCNLQVWGIIDELENDDFIRLAEKAKDTCPIAKLLNAQIILEANLEDDSHMQQVS